MGRTYEYASTYKHEGYVQHERDGVGWTDGSHNAACGSNGWFRAACTCGWVASAEHYKRFEGECWLPEAEEDRLMEEWEQHMRPLVLVAEVSDADDAAKEAADVLRAAVYKARVNGASWTDLGRALGVTKQAAQQRFGL